MTTTYKTTRPTSGEFIVNTRRNSYWIKLRQGIVVDAAPVLREYYLYREVCELLDGIYRRDGRYEVRKIIK